MRLERPSLVATRCHPWDVPLGAIEGIDVDLLADRTPTVEHPEASESWQFPPDYDVDDPHMRRDLGEDRR